MDVLDFANSKGYDFIFYNSSCDHITINGFKKILNRNKETTVRLYHGTSSKHNIFEEGLKPTSKYRRRSYQSTSGYVYLSIFPGLARVFGEMAYPMDNITVYAVDVPIKLLRPDLDQIRNKRLYGNFIVGNSLAESLIFGHAARVKGKIESWRITRLVDIKVA